MLLSALRKRWPVLTTAVAALIWLMNNYDIRGLDGLRIEPRAAVPSQDMAYGSTPFGLPTSFSTGPALPGTAAANSYDAGANYSGQQYGNPFANQNANSSPFATQGYSTGYPSAASAGLPGTSPAGTGPNIPINPTNPLGGLNVDALRPAVKALGGQEWDQLLTVGEKLGMLERTRQTVPSAAPVYQTQTNNSLAGAQRPAATIQPRDTIRIASFNLSGWGDASRDQPHVSEMIIRLIGQFDVIALQDIRSKRDDLLPNLMIELNRGGRAFDFMIGPRVGRGEVREQLAFVFDTDRVETDRFQLYTVADPEDIVTREPLVGWFRTKQVNSLEAFTFSLVNIHIDGNMATAELGALPNLVEAIYNDGRGEDDIILAGDFSAASTQAQFFTSGLFRCAIEGVATNTRGSQLLDNIAMPVMGSTEFMGRGGAVDFLRQYNMGLEQALAVSEHLPIWAEFSVVEGGRPGQVAGNLMPERNFHTGQTN